MPYLATERARRDGWPADNGALPATTSGSAVPRTASAAEPARAAEARGAAERPLVLTRPVGAAQVIEQVCPRAAARGLRPGITLGQAQAQAPDLVALPCAPAQDRAVLERLANWALRFSPVVEAVTPDALLVDITGCALLFGGEEQIARQAVTGLARQGFRARAAIADTVGAAWALALAGHTEIASAPPGQASAWIAPLPPHTLRIDPRASERLDLLGVRSIGDLLMLPRATLPARFGAQLVLRLQQALGEVYEGVTPFLPEAPPAAQVAFEGPVADRPAIEAAAEPLLADVFDQMQRRALALRQLDCVLYYDRMPPRVLAIGLARPTRAREHVARLLAERLAQVDFSGGGDPADGGNMLASAPGRVVAGVERFDPTPGITGLKLVARITSRWHTQQAELFEPAEPGADEALGTLIDRLAGRLGHAAILRPRLIDDHQPERAFRYVSVAEAGWEKEGEEGFTTETQRRREDNRNGAGGGVSAQVSGACSPGLGPGPLLARPVPLLARPVRLLARPMPIRVIALVPDGPPTWLALRGREYTIAAAAGPERIETAWWRGPDVRRDYFRVLVETGEQFWIFHDSNAQEWFLHGWFA